MLRPFLFQITLSGRIYKRKAAAAEEEDFAIQPCGDRRSKVWQLMPFVAL